MNTMSTRPQHLDALDLANEVRLARAAFKRTLKSLPQHAAFALIADRLEQHDPLVEGCRIGEALRACTGIQHASAQKFMRHMGATSLDRRLDELTDRQRDLLISALRDPSTVRPYGGATRPNGWPTR